MSRRPKAVNKRYPDGQIVTYPSVTIAAKLNYISQPGMMRRVKTGNKYDGYRYEYADRGMG